MVMSPQHPTEDYRQQLEELYRQHCPEKLRKIDTLLATYEGRERHLINKVGGRMTFLVSQSIVLVSQLILYWLAGQNKICVIIVAIPTDFIPAWLGRQ
jgi:hypothetical protein